MRVHSLGPHRERLQRAFSLLPLILMVSGFGAASGQSAKHPLDPLTWEEHWIVLDAIRTAGHATDSTRYSLVSLQPPAKSEVLAWRAGQPFSRAAFAIVKEGASTFEAEVDLSSESVVSWKEIEGVQPSWLEEEFGASAAIAMENEEFREALHRRGFADLSRIECFGLPLGYFGTPAERGRRLATVECVDAWRTRNTFARLIPGVTAIVDMDAREVLEVRDGDVVPVAVVNADFDAASLGPPRDTGAPISVEQPLGPGFELDGQMVRWQKWSFHHRMDPRVGTVLSAVRYQDGDRSRSVLYEGHLSEIFVPYMDPSAPWYAYNFLDAGEFSAGGLAHPMEPGLDCPENSVYFDMILAGDDGKPRVKRNVSCLFERYAGDVAWRKRSDNLMESRPKRDLVLRMMAVLGNYDYILDWVFQQDGSIEVVAGATGIDATKAVAERVAGESGPAWSADRTDAYGRFIAENLVGVNHDHFFSFRLDLDVDGPVNSLEIDRLVTKRLPDDHPRRSVWVVEPSLAGSEADAKLRIDLEHPALWRVINPTTDNHLGYPVSYQLVPGANAASLLDRDDYPQMRAGFTDYHVWVTPYRADERHAAGLYPTLSEPGQGLPAWTSADRPIRDTDIVVWYTMGFHHVPRPEDWPVMPTVRKSFELRPYGFFDRNPALDLPACP
ncbi:MAG: tyramine oxidase [Gemmatimonadetes bacterium]|nr:tyramine oxidase [Gemmatimonadota bacterium]